MAPNREKSRSILQIVYRALESSLNGVLITNKRSRIVYVNASLLNLLGYGEKSDLVGHPVSELFNRNPIQTLKDIYHILKTTDYKTLKLPIVTKQGKNVMVEVSVSNVYDQESRIIGKMASLIDITAMLRLKENLVKAETRIHHLSSKILERDEMQRKLIARELHDAVGSNLTAVKLALENKQVSSSDPLQALEFSQIIDIIQKTIDEIHVICNNLRPTILDKLGLGKAIESLCRELGRITPSIRIHCTLDFETTDIPESLQLVIYRVIQEALNNAVKHSQATMIQVDLKSGSSSIDLEIADNGKGFSLKRSYGNITHPSQGLGLQSMQERAEMYGGCFAIFSEEHKGTMVRSAWPVKRH